MKMEGQFGRRRACTSTAALTAIAYIIGMLTSPLLVSTPSAPCQQQQTPPPPRLPRGLECGLANPADTGQLAAYNATCRLPPVSAAHVRQKLIDEIFNGTSPYSEFPPPHVRGLLQRRRVKGWGSTSAVFADLIREVRPRVIIEVGTFLGASALHMATLARGLGLNVSVLCVDDFRGWPGFRRKLFKSIRDVNGDNTLLYQFMQNVVTENLTDTVLPVPFSSTAALRALCEWGIYGDLVEVDAAHDFLSAWSDINAAYALLAPGGRSVIFGHDYHTKFDNHGVRRAVQLFAKLRGLRVEPRGEHWVLRSQGSM